MGKAKWIICSIGVLVVCLILYLVHVKVDLDTNRGQVASLFFLIAIAMTLISTLKSLELVDEMRR
ncbi:hypothetical protein Lauda_00050 [Pseudomonas phage vB_PpuM-Lauda]